MEGLSLYFLSFIDDFGYLAVAFLMALENMCIPIPSELILGFAGYLVFMGKMSFSLAFWAGVIGGMVGSILAYYAGALGGRPFVDAYGKYFLIKKSHVDFAQKWFDKYGIMAVFFSRMLPVVRTFISLPAGFAKVRMMPFLIYTFIGTLPWTLLLLYAGFFLGEKWEDILEIGHEASLVVVALLAIVAFYFYKKRGARS